MAGMDGKELIAALKQAKKKPRNFLFAAGTKLEEHYLFISKKRIPRSMKSDAKAAAKTPKVYFGVCEYDKATKTLVFSTTEAFADKQEKGIRKLFKQRLALKSIEPELRLVATIEERDFDDVDEGDLDDDDDEAPVSAAPSGGPEEEEEQIPAGASTQASEPVAATATVEPLSPEKYETAQKAWDKTREVIAKDVEKLKKEIVKQMKDAPDPGGVVKAVKQLDEVLDGLGDTLSKALNASAKAKNADDARKGHESAQKLIREYETFLKRDPIMKGIDDNPFTKVSVRKTADAALKALSKTINAN